MSAATSSRRPSARRRAALALALALPLLAAPAATAADGVLATTPPQVTPARNAAGSVVALQCASGTWWATPSGRVVLPALSYSWLADALPAGGADSALYAVEAADAGKSLTCVVNAVFALGSGGTTTTYRGVAYSAPFRVLEPPPPTTITRTVGAATLVMPRATTRAVGRSGAVTVASGATCSGRCTVTVVASVRIGRTTHRLSLRRTVGATSTTLVLVLPRAARAALARAARVRAALTALAGEPSPWGEESLARHVQIYIPTPGWMLNDPSGWRDAWAILAAGGGVWIETFRAREGRPVAWAAADWASFPGAVSDALRGAGGDPGRLHLLIGPGPQARTWRLARTGRACALLSNGPGAYRVGRDAGAFLDEFHAAFGADGSGSPRCLPERALGPRTRRALVAALRLADGGLVRAGALTARPRLAAGRRANLRVALGPDPLGIAGRFGVPREGFWRRARPRLTVLGAGVARTVRLPRSGDRVIALLPRDTGALEVRLLVDGSAIRWAAGGPADLARALPSRPAMSRIRPRLAASPATWDLTVPLRIPGRACARATIEVGR